MQNNTVSSTRQNPLTFYFRTLLYMFIALLLRVVTFAPLACLFVFPVGSYWRYLALLCPLLLIFFLLPLRFSFATALVQPSRTRSFSFDTALSMERYGEKLGDGLLHLLSVAKWGLPLAAMLLYGYFYYKSTDFISLVASIATLGRTVTNFFLTLFGNINTLNASGGLSQGIWTLAGIVGVGVLILLYGAMRNSAYRYIWALSAREDRNPRSEVRRRLRGRRLKQFGVAVVNLILWVPFLLAIFVSVKDVLSDVSTILMNLFTSQELDLSGLTAAIFPLLFAFFVLYMPLLPIRRYLTAFYATKKIRHAASQRPAQAVPSMSDAAEPEVVSFDIPTTSSGAMNVEENDQSPSYYYPTATAAYIPMPQEPIPPSYTAVAEAPSFYEESLMSEEQPEAEDQPEAEEQPVEETPSAFQSDEPPLYQPQQDVDPSAFTIGQ